MIGPVLRRPTAALLPEYAAALAREWSPDNTNPKAWQRQLNEIARDPDGFLARFDDPEGAGPQVTLPDGQTVPRLPSFRRWIWRDGFAGTIGLRWQEGTTALPPTCLGHIGYAVVPWRRREGLATAALVAILPLARAQGLTHMDITADPENTASHGVITKAGGTFVGSFEKPAAYGGGRDHLYRIALGDA